MPENLKNKKVVITGGNRGIGRAIALAFAKKGCDVVITYHIAPEKAETVVGEIAQYGVKAKAIQCDVSHEKHREQLVRESLNFLGKIDILVNNAGIVIRKSFLKTSEEDFEKTLAVNGIGPTLLIQAVALQMKKQQEENKARADYSIINITSLSKKITTPDLIAYEASKAYLGRITKSIATELVQYGIRVNEVAPGLVATDINRSQWEDSTALWQKRVASIPINRPVKDEEIAHAVIALAENTGMVGFTMVVDGGRAGNHLGSELHVSQQTQLLAPEVAVTESKQEELETEV